MPPALRPAYIFPFNHGAAAYIHPYPVQTASIMCHKTVNSWFSVTICDTKVGEGVPIVLNNGDIKRYLFEKMYESYMFSNKLEYTKHKKVNGAKLVFMHKNKDLNLDYYYFVSWLAF